MGTKITQDDCSIADISDCVSVKIILSMQSKHFSPAYYYFVFQSVLNVDFFFI